MSVAPGTAGSWRLRDQPIRAAYADASGVMAAILAMDEAAEGIAASRKQRPLRWSGA